MALPKDIANIGSIANAMYNSITANTTAITSLSASSITVSGNATMNTIVANGATGTTGQVLSSNGSGLYWSNINTSLLRSARTTNTILVSTDRSSLIDITSGTFTQTFTAAATLGSGWHCYIRNGGTGDIELEAPSAVSTTSTTSNSIAAGTTWTVGTGLSISAGDLVIVRRTADPFAQRIVGTVSSYNSGTGSLVVTVGYRIGSGTYTDWTITTRASTAGIDGLASYVMYPGETRLMQCNGLAFFSVLLTSFSRLFTTSETFIRPSGYTEIDVEVVSGGGGGGGGPFGQSQTGSGGLGGSGGNRRIEKITLLSTAAVTVTVGAGGTAGPGRTTAAGFGAGTGGGTGGNSSFGTFFSSTGGIGGTGGSSGTNIGQGAAGAAVTAAAGASGGAGAGYNVASAFAGGAGGSSGGIAGGAGGTGGTNPGGNGSPGVAGNGGLGPLGSGGGGGGNCNAPSGSGVGGDGGAAGGFGAGGGGGAASLNFGGGNGAAGSPGYVMCRGLI